MKKSDRVILLTNHYIYGFSVSSKSVTRDVQIAVADNMIEEFRDYLLKGPCQPVKIVVNVFEEEFSFDKTPHTTGADRKNLLNRKLIQHYKQSDLRRYEVQGRGDQGRKDDEVMFSSLGSSRELQTLIDVLYSTKTPIAGIWSAPQLGKKFLAPIIAGRDVMIMSEIDNGTPDRVAVRQSFFKAGRFKLTRVGMIEVASRDSVRQDVGDELESSRQYLLRERYIKDDQKLDVVFISSSEYLSALSGFTGEVARHFAFEHVGTAALAQVLNIVCSSGNASFEDIVAASLVKYPVRAHYSCPRSNYFRKHQLAASIAGKSAIAASLALVASSAYFVFMGVQKQSELTDEQAIVARLDQEYAERKSAVSNLPEDIYQVKHAVDKVQSVQQSQAQPIDIYNIVSQGLVAYPNLQITRLEWFVDERESSEASSYGEDDFSGDSYGNGDDYWGEEPEKHRTTVVTIAGNAQGYSTNVRQLVDDFEAFTGLLGKDKRVGKVNVVTLPVKVNPDEELSGKIIGDALDTQAYESFALELELKHAAG